MVVSDPATLRRRLRVELKRARNAAGLTQRDVAEALDWSPSKIIRIESGAVGVSTTDLMALAERYSIGDKFDELASMAKGSKKQPWSQYKEILSPELIRYFSYEASVRILRQFEISLVPGLLQTEQYTRAVLRDVFQLEPPQVDDLVEIRLERQELLERPEPPEMYFLIDEAVISRNVGGSAVMRRQLDRLRVLAQRPTITIQIIPFSFGGHFGMSGPFTYLEFADPNDDDVLYLENSRGDAVFRDEPEITEPYREAYWELEKAASPPDDLESWLRDATTRLSSGFGRKPGEESAE